MRHDPVYLVFDVRCPSPDEVAKIEELVHRLGRRDAVQTHTVTGAGKTTDVSHRIGDFFEDILVIPGVGEDPRALRLVFHRRPDAGRFWKDLMVRMVRSVVLTFPSAAVALAYQGDEDRDWARLSPVSAHTRVESIQPPPGTRSPS